MRKKAGRKKRLKSGRFSDADKDFVRANYLVLADKEIAEHLNRSVDSITNLRRRQKWHKDDEGGEEVQSEFRSSYVAGLEEDDKRQFFVKELRVTSLYREVKKILTKDELKFYEERFVEFMMDPTIETMTAAERDTLNRKTLTEIRMLRFMDEEKMTRDMLTEAKMTDDTDVISRLIGISKSRDIADCQQVIKECEKMLNVTREQRLRNSSDQAVNFTTLIKDLQNPATRREAGYEAAMFRWMARKHFNEHLGTNVFSGSVKEYDTEDEFKAGIEPEGLKSEPEIQQ